MLNENPICSYEPRQKLPNKKSMVLVVFTKPGCISQGSLGKQNLWGERDLFQEIGSCGYKGCQIQTLQGERTLWRPRKSQYCSSSLKAVC